MNRIHFRYRPAVRTRGNDKLPFHVDWRSGGLAGISTNDAAEAAIWRRDRRDEGLVVIEQDAISKKSPPARVSMRERLARAIENGRGDFSPIERACIAKALRARRRREPHPVELSRRLMATAKGVKANSLILELCPISRHERALVRDYLDRIAGW